MTADHAHARQAGPRADRPGTPTRALMPSPTPAPPRPSLLDVQRTAGNRAAIDVMARTGAHREPMAGLPPATPATAPGASATAPSVLRARLPDDTDLGAVLAPGPNEAPATAGLRRLLLDAMAEMTGAQKSAIHAAARGSLSHPDFSALAAPERLRRIAAAIRSLHPDRELGDPAQYESRLRTGADRANLTTLLSNTDQLFADILAAPSLDTWITEIFGAGQRSRVLRRLQRARRGLQAAGRRQTITADMSGYSEHVGLGGWAVFQTHISLERRAIQSPADSDSIQLTFHEAMHFGTGSVVDTVYLENSSDFTTLATDDKVNNAAHYEVLALRTRSPADALAFPAPNNVFTPATSAGPTATMTPADEGRRFANRRYRDAWSSSIDIWEELRRVHRGPRAWASARRYLPFWSAVERLTMHERSIRASRRPDEAPVTLLDLALAESFTRKLRGVWRILRSQPASVLETAHATASELAAATTAEHHRDLLVKCALREAGIQITGAEDRDAEVLRLLHVNASRLFTPRDPASAPAP